MTNPFTWPTSHGDVVEVYTDADGQHRFRVRAANGEIVESGEAYVRKSQAVEAARRHHPQVESDD